MQDDYQREIIIYYDIIDFIVLLFVLHDMSHV